MSSPFDSLSEFRNLFTAGLGRLLDAPDLGAYVLVLANALYDEGLSSQLHEPLQRRFEEHLGRVRRTLAGGQEPKDARDDLLVFLKLATIGLDALGATERRMSGPWELQFNLLRAFRPRRMSASVGGGAQLAFDPAGFHFNKPFLRKETIWQGELAGRSVDLLYNKFPFVDLHGLLVPEREAELPQFLTREWHDYAWGLSGEMSAALPGIGFGYNSYGAFASVNHLHLQLFVREAPLPLAAPRWVHNGGDEPYPSPCARFDESAAAWRYLDHLHRESVPYNLVYLPGRLYCLPRARQGDYRHAPWTGGFAWYEMAGGMVTFRRGDFESLAPGQVAEELRRVGGVD
jgi:hypothetical protein